MPCKLFNLALIPHARSFPQTSTYLWLSSYLRGFESEMEFSLWICVEERACQQMELLKTHPFTLSWGYPGCFMTRFFLSVIPFPREASSNLLGGQWISRPYYLVSVFVLSLHRLSNAPAYSL